MGGVDGREGARSARVGGRRGGRAPAPLAVAHRTGDLSLLREKFEPDQAQLLVPGAASSGRRGRGACLAAAALAEHAAWAAPTIG